MGRSERRMTAFLDGEDSPDIPNPIHSTEVARQYGYEAALVGGVTVYGWTARAVLDVLGEAWLDHGWADVRFRRPVYPGNELTITVEGDADGAELVLANEKGEGCLVGTIGLGEAPWLGELAMPDRRRAEPPLETRPRLTPETAPIGEDLRPVAVPYGEGEALEYATAKQRDAAPPWTGEGARIHPGWLAARMTPMIHHSFDYGPAIHARSQVQHLAPALAGQTVTVAGHFLRAYERKGHHYGEVDGVILGEDGGVLTRIRHTTIYQVGKRG